MPPPADELASFMHALGKRESGNNYQAIGTDQGSKYGVAQGRYQIMSRIWPDWARKAGYAGADWRDPRAQDAVAAWRMSQYYDRYNGDWSLVAAAWLGGQGTADEIVQGNGSAWRRDDGFVSVREYVDDIMANLGETPTNVTAVQRNQPGQPDGVSQAQHSVTALGDALGSGTTIPQQTAAANQPRNASQVAVGVLNQLSRIAQANAEDPNTQDQIMGAMNQIYRPEPEGQIFEDREQG